MRVPPQTSSLLGLLSSQLPQKILKQIEGNLQAVIARRAQIFDRSDFGSQSKSAGRDRFIGQLLMQKRVLGPVTTNRDRRHASQSDPQVCHAVAARAAGRGETNLRNCLSLARADFAIVMSQGLSRTRQVNRAQQFTRTNVHLFVISMEI